MYKMFSDTQANALEIWTQKAKAQRDERRAKGIHLFCLWTVSLERDSKE